ncbi:hypothetical protein X802_05720 [Thermococcus guaymasensis DSM 11113]|uniref:Flavodoxin-like domain-containing protein n=1 Tax=Thermococcus guaymasensis DSM 11113 TaxID=1432656 RepID=A0A0X1KKD0_9EURY|nr:flavodoxin domain-containing protein [Thermococcus guaymasensis]AJC71719.1 hypothetical protein X802_05720 [Thermococcus guaymasensis DSM 11113]
MKACVIYATRRGSTKRVAEVIAEELKRMNVEVRLMDVNENPPVEDCDLLILGAPVYYERPLPEIRRFIEFHNGLRGKKVALFILCIAEKFGNAGRCYTERRYLRLMVEPIAGEVVAQKVFEGWIFKENPKTIEEARDWARRLFRLLRREKT